MCRHEQMPSQEFHRERVDIVCLILQQIPAVNILSCYQLALQAHLDLYRARKINGKKFKLIKMILRKFYRKKNHGKFL